MGQAIRVLAERDPQFSICGIWGRDDNLDALLANADVVVDFSLPEGTVAVLDAALRSQTPVVCGVSGLNNAQLAALDAAANSIAIVYDRNMSQGITVLDAVAGHAASALGSEFRLSIEETHHRHKKDAPSGTALKLAESLAAARGIDVGDISIASERRGEVAGDHDIIFETPTERLVFRHSVTSRDVFASGALAAAAWVASRGPGRYSMNDVLFGR